MSAVLSDAIGKQLVAAWGLPQKTKCITIDINAGDLVNVVVEFYPDQAHVDSLLPLLEQYKLVRKQEESDEL